MSISSQFNSSQNDLLISVSGDFVAAFHKDFKRAYQCDRTNVKRYLVDMRNVHYLDQSALEMLIELKEYAKLHGGEVGIINMQDAVLRIFHVLRFHKVFKPHYEPALRKIIWVSNVSSAK